MILKNDSTVVTSGNSTYITNSIKNTVNNMTGVKQIFKNNMAFALIKNDGTVYSWGQYIVESEFSSLKNITNIFPTVRGFIAIDNTNTIYSWGESSILGSTSATKPASNTTSIKNVVCTYYGTGVLTTDNKLIEWGHTHLTLNNGVLTNIKDVFSGSMGIVALKNDGGVTVFGYDNYTDERYLSDGTKGVRGHNSSTVNASLLDSDISSVHFGFQAMAALKTNGSVVAWGYQNNGGNFHNTTYGARDANSSTVNPSLLSSGVKEIHYTNTKSFVAIKDNGSIVIWGGGLYGNIHHATYGARIPGTFNSNVITPSGLSSGVVKIFSNDYAVCALKNDGSIVTWGHSSYGGNMNVANFDFTSGIVDIVSTQYAFACVKSDGSAVAWGGQSHGGSITNTTTGARGKNSISVDATLLNSGVTNLFSNIQSVCALKEDGSIVIWGDPTHGGNIHDSTNGINALVVI